MNLQLGRAKSLEVRLLRQRSVGCRHQGRTGGDAAELAKSRAEAEAQLCETLEEFAARTDQNRPSAAN